MDQVQESFPEASKPPKRHSGLGIASFIISLVSILGLIAAMVVMVASLGDAIADPSAFDPNDPALTGFGPILAASFGMFIFVILAFVGAILGIVGLFQKDRSKLFAILGTVFNSLIVLAFIILFIIGLIIGAASGQL